MVGSPEAPDPPPSNSESPVRHQNDLVQYGNDQSDASDEETEIDRNGYLPLGASGNDAVQELGEIGGPEENLDGEFQFENIPTTETAPEAPAVLSAETEISVEVWNAPRPEISDIALDEGKTAEIKNIMAGFKLPATAQMPAWMQSEESWREVLSKIRPQENAQKDN